MSNLNAGYFGYLGYWYNYLPEDSYPDFQNTNEWFTASSNIGASKFVTLLPNGTLAQSISGDEPLGVSMPGTNSGTPDKDGLFWAASAGQTLNIFGVNNECWLYYGEDVFAGQFLVPDDLGRAVVAATGASTGAYALEAGSAGELHRVRVLRKQNLAPFREFDDSYTNEYD